MMYFVELIAKGLGLLFIGACALAAVAVLFYIISKFSKANAEASTTIVQAEEVKEEEEDKDAVSDDFDYKNFKNTPFRLNDYIHGRTKNYRVQWVSVYGHRYNSIEEAISQEPRLKPDVITLMRELDADFERIHESVAKKNRYQVLTTPFEDDIYVYQEGLVTLNSGTAAPRMLIQIEKDDDGSMVVGFAKVSATNVLKDNNAYEFDLMDPEHSKVFEVLVENNKDKYALEIKDYNLVKERLARYNSVRHRVSENEDGTFKITPPSLGDISK